jgi:hypothetical protein
MRNKQYRGNDLWKKYNRRDKERERKKETEIMSQP